MDDSDFISKTRRKRRMVELQAVGEALVALSPERLAHLDIPEALREAVLDAQRFSKHEAVRRQRQYIGRLMRDVDAGPIIEQLEALRAPSRRETAILHLAERWREDLLTEPGAASRFLEEFPRADPHRLRVLAEAALEERRRARAPKKFRELFHLVTDILRDHAKRQP